MRFLLCFGSEHIQLLGHFRLAGGEHIIPFDLGGPTEIENAQLLHKWCNRSKGNRLQTEFDFEDDSQEDADENE